MSIQSTMAPVAAPFAAIRPALARFRARLALSPAVRAALWETVDIVGNLAAVATLLCAVALWCLALSPGPHS